MVVAKGDQSKELAKRKRGEQTKLRWGKGKDPENTRKIVAVQPAWGDFMSHETDKCRILYNNVNTISYGSALADCSLLAENAVKRGAEIVGWVETNIDWTYRDIKWDCTQIVRKAWKHAKMSVSSSTEVFETPYQPGGTATIVGGAWAGRATTANDSELGRWSEIRLEGKANKAVSIITAYGVIEKNTSGEKTVYAQQRKILERQGIHNPEPRSAMFKDLGARIKTLIGQGEEIILLIDTNDSLSDPRSKFTGWTNENKLVDILVQQHGSEDEPATYAGGSKRIDYILMTPKISEFVEAAGILELKAYSDSDHRALYADIDMAAFLGGKPSPLENSTLRGISSGDPRAVKQYTEALEKELRERRIEERMAEIITSIENNGGVASEAHRAGMEELEESFSEARIKSEKKCKHIRSHPWSPTLRSAREDVRYWKLWLSQYKLEMDFTQQRVEISEQAHERETTVHR
jgi:hypothetical protein